MTTTAYFDPNQTSILQVINVGGSAVDPSFVSQDFTVRQPLRVNVTEEPPHPPRPPQPMTITKKDLKSPFIKRHALPLAALGAGLIGGGLFLTNDLKCLKRKTPKESHNDFVDMLNSFSFLQH